MSITPYQKQMTGNKALYHVCYKLSELGWNAMPTARNAAGVDILCINEEGDQMISVQVKGRSKRASLGIPPSRDKIMGDFWIVVTEFDYGAPTCYILLPDEIEKGRSSRTNKSGKIVHYFNLKKDNIEPSKEKWKRIGSGFSIE